MKSKIITTALVAAFISMFVSPFAISKASPPNSDELGELVKGLVFTINKSEQQDNTLVVRLENHTANGISLLPDALLHPNVSISVESPDHSSAQNFFASHEMPTDKEDINSASQGKQINVLEPGKSFEVSLKIPDLINSYDAATQDLINKALGKVKIRLTLSFDNLIVGIGGNKNPEDAFNTTFKAPEWDLSK